MHRQRIRGPTGGDGSFSIKLRNLMELLDKSANALAENQISAEKAA
jgi:hypothetical protein